jgi:ABC-type taurine transport system ATPase subunit
VANIDDVAEEIGRRITETVYVGVGLGVLAFQRAQVRRRELSALLDQRVGESRTVARSVEQGLLALDDRAVALEAMVFERLEPALPEAARAALEQARAVATTVRAQVRERLNQAAAV